MNDKKNLLNIEVVGSQDRPITDEDRKAFTKFFKSRKANQADKRNIERRKNISKSFS